MLSRESRFESREPESGRIDWRSFMVFGLSTTFWFSTLDFRPSTRRAVQVTGPEFVAQPVDGDAVVGKLAAIDKPWRIVLQASAHATLDGDGLVSVRRKDRTPSMGPSGSQLLLANGDRIRAIATRITQDTLHANSELLGNMEIPLERVLALVFSPPSEAAEREQFCRRLTTVKHNKDAVVLANGDQLAGTVLGLDDTHIQLDAPQGPIEINRTGVCAIMLNPELTSFPMPKQLYAETLLTDGSELAMLEGRLDRANLRGRAAWGQDVSIPLEQLIALEFRNGRLTYLSDLDPAEYHHTPYLSISYPFQRDRSVLGNRLSLRGQVFRKGVSMHTRSEITYTLGGDYHRFEAVVGIDDETAGRGSVQFRVLVDGEQSWESRTLTGRAAPESVRVALDGAKRLTLIVDFADLGDVQDHADWADARLVR